MLARLALFAALLGHPRARHLLVLCGVVAGLMLGVGTAWLVLSARNNDIGASLRELRNLSLVLADETDQAFQSMELVQRSLIEHLREEGIDTPEKFDRDLATQEVQHDLHSRLVGLPQISALALVSRGGRMVSFSRSWPPPPIDDTDRDFYQMLIRDPSQVAFIGAPVRSRGNGAWTILFARPYAGPSGQLIGMVTTSLQIDQLDRLFAGIAVGGDPSFSLFRGDGVLLSRYPRVDRVDRPSSDTSGGFHTLLGSVENGVVEHTGMADGKPRLIAPHGVAHYPLLLVATNTVEAALQSWRARTVWMAAVAAVAELVLAGTVLLGVRQLRGQERLIAANAAVQRSEAALQLAQERERSTQDARRRAQQFDLAVSNMRQGLAMFDHEDRLLVANRRFIELVGGQADAVPPGTTATNIMELAVARGSFSHDDVAALHRWRQTVRGKLTEASNTFDMTDGRVLVMTHQPMEGGWLVTYEDITERREAQARMAYMARHDALTDLPNRVLFHERLAEALANARRGRSLALLCLDLDQFKTVNDTLGHPIGDALLQAVAGRLAERIRDTDTVVRLGGDEFAVVQVPIDKPTEAADFAERLIQMLEEPFEIEGHQIVIGTSIGIAFAPQDGLSADELLKNADLALYRAKADGRGVYRVFQVAMDAEMQARRLLELDLRNALHGDQFEVYYQPLIDLKAEAVAGFEALLRWHHPARGLIPPDQFIPLAEEIGAIAPIGEWVLRQACLAAAGWPGTLGISVNLSPVQFKSRDLVATVTAALCDARLEPGRLELEITETVMLHDTVATLATLHDLRSIGVRVAMDDFGTGYSSLSYLRRFPFERIKIDQSFVRELGKQSDCGAIIRAVISLSRDLGMATTAEGVETREQLRALAEAGCSGIQGFLFSRPIPLRDIPAVLRNMPLVGDLLRQTSLVA
jgi:diguanylate cyclase (GGDEF)-like protein